MLVNRMVLGACVLLAATGCGKNSELDKSNGGDTSSATTDPSSSGDGDASGSGDGDVDGTGSASTTASGDGDGDSESGGSGGDSGGSLSTGGSGASDGSGGQLVVDDPIELPDAPNHYGSGDRLKIVVEQLDGGPTFFKTFYDSKYEVPCIFYDVGSKMYCIPELRLGYEFRGYADADCTSRAFESTDDCDREQPTMRRADDCNHSDAWGINRVETDVPLYSLDSNGTCSPTGQTLAAESALVETPDDFSTKLVSGVRKFVPIQGKRLGLIVVESEDGAFAPIGLYDPELDIHCPKSLREGECRPAAATYVDLFVDDQCLLSTGLGQSTTPPHCNQVDWIFKRGGSGEEDSSYRVDSAFSGEVYKAVSQDQCVAANTSSSITYYFYEPGEKLTEPFADTSEIRIGTGRVQAFATQEGGDTIRMNPFYLFDTERNEECSSVYAKDELVCVPLDRPSYNSGAEQYEDSACTQRLIDCRSGTNCPGTFYWEVRPQCDQSNLFVNIRRVLSEYTDDVYELDDSGACVGPVPPKTAWTWEFVEPAQSGLPLMNESILP